jgi:hypothetical protein
MKRRMLAKFKASPTYGLKILQLCKVTNKYTRKNFIGFYKFERHVICINNATTLCQQEGPLHLCRSKRPLMCERCVGLKACHSHLMIYLCLGL